jgi:peptidoglycan/LPS O-acetylase OafA/YrhL
MEIRKLNTLRGLAAMIVVVSHYANATGAFASSLGLGAGQYGVMLFFLLSGFLMALLYLERPCSASAIRAFAIARLARVVPLFTIVVVASFLLLRAGIGAGVVYDIDSKHQLLAHILMLSGTSVLWTIPPEMQFYLCFVVLWKLFSLQRHYLWIGMAALLAGGILTNFDARTYSVFGFDVQTRLIFGLPFFLTGMIFGHVFRRTQESAAQSHWFALLLGAIPLLYPGIAHRFLGRDWTLWQDVEPLILMTMVFAGLVFLVPRGNRVMENAVGDFLGRVSFSLYLLHLPILNAMTSYARMHPGRAFPIFLSLTLAISALSFRLIESPMQRIVRNALNRAWPEAHPHPIAVR